MQVWFTSIQLTLLEEGAVVIADENGDRLDFVVDSGCQQAVEVSLGAFKQVDRDGVVGTVDVLYRFPAVDVHTSGGGISTFQVKLTGTELALDGSEEVYNSGVKQNGFYVSCGVIPGRKGGCPRVMCRPRSLIVDIYFSLNRH